MTPKVVRCYFIEVFRTRKDEVDGFLVPVSQPGLGLQGPLPLLTGSNLANGKKGGSDVIPVPLPQSRSCRHP